MAIQTGNLWLVAVDTADTPATPTYTSLPQQTAGSMSFSTSRADGTNKSNSGWSNGITVSRSWSVSGGGMSDENDTALLFLIDTIAFGANTDHAFMSRVTNEDGDTYIGLVELTALDWDFSGDSIVAYTFTILNRGAPSNPTRA